MSFFQCAKCGCRENTALSQQGFIFESQYDWTGLEDFKGKRLCSVCGPTHYSSGEPREDAGKWHGVFERKFLPMGQYATDRIGNLVLKEQGL